MSTKPVSLAVLAMISVLSGLLLWLAWPPLPAAGIIFFAFIPLLYVIEELEQKGAKKITYWLLVYSALLVWNVLTTWWVGKASVAGGLFANFANPALQSIPFMLARATAGRLGKRYHYLALVCYWMAFEYLHLRWEFTWPWLSLGNVFAARYEWVQWYAYTGMFGGTLWVWLVNILAWMAIRNWLVLPGRTVSKVAASLAVPVVLVIVPVVLGYSMYGNYTDQGKTFDVVMLQPNFDPYEEKFTTPADELMKTMLDMTQNSLDSTTDFLIWPETSVPHTVLLNRPDKTRPLRMLRAVTDSFPNLTTIAGVMAMKQYQDGEAISVTARNVVDERKSDTIYYDIFNAAIQVDTSGVAGAYYKSKLVPGVERMPYPQALAFLKVFTIDLGGIEGSLGTQPERSIFSTTNGAGIAPVICYESVFGEYVTRYIRNGANLIFIMTNDGWWGNTAGYKQHCQYASLRAIETRRSIARCANTGISCFINQRGDISQPSKWDEAIVLEGKVAANEATTFYVQHGDYLARTAIWIGFLLWLLSLVKRFSVTFKVKRNE